jgi:hypothetical protein
MSFDEALKILIEESAQAGPICRKRTQSEERPSIEKSEANTGAPEDNEESLVTRTRRLSFRG